MGSVARYFKPGGWTQLGGRQGPGAAPFVFHRINLVAVRLAAYAAFAYGVDAQGNDGPERRRRAGLVREDHNRGVVLLGEGVQTAEMAHRNLRIRSGLVTLARTGSVDHDEAERT
jgi:hypothetical protein